MSSCCSHIVFMMHSITPFKITISTLSRILTLDLQTWNPTLVLVVGETLKLEKLVGGRRRRATRGGDFLRWKRRREGKLGEWGVYGMGEGFDKCCVALFRLVVHTFQGEKKKRRRGESVWLNWLISFDSTRHGGVCIVSTSQGSVCVSLCVSAFKRIRYLHMKNVRITSQLKTQISYFGALLG